MGIAIYFIGVVVTLIVLIRWLRNSEELEGEDTVDIFLTSFLILVFSLISWFTTFAIFLTWLLKRK